jgi:hypothetical protein
MSSNLPDCTVRAAAAAVAAMAAAAAMGDMGRFEAINMPLISFVFVFLLVQHVE